MFFSKQLFQTISKSGVTRTTSRGFSSSAFAQYASNQGGKSGDPLPTFNTLKVELNAQDRVGVITLNRPKDLNALCDELLGELDQALKHLDTREDVGCLILTGSDRAFAAGADIKEMAPKNFVESYQEKILGDFRKVELARTPIIAVVNGFALGGGCELAMSCDMIYAGDKAKFGQPEIKLGTIPGAGGTQRLIRAVGKSKAMELCLTGKMMDAQEAKAYNLVSGVYPADEVMNKALEDAKTIASYSKPIVELCKFAINQAEETTLETGLRFERRIFEATFATKDKMEGMGSFVAKKDPKWQHK